MNRNQAMKPEKGEVIQNELGSARGLYFKKGGCHFFALPGVPKEMKAIVFDQKRENLDQKTETANFCRCRKEIISLLFLLFLDLPPFNLFLFFFLLFSISVNYAFLL